METLSSDCSNKKRFDLNEFWQLYKNKLLATYYT